MNQSVLNRSRNDKFTFIMDIPKALKNMSDAVMGTEYTADKIQFTTYGSPVPEISIPSISVPFGGQVYNTSSMSRPAYNPLSLKFLIDNGYKNYWVLWQWLNLFNDNENSSTEITKPTLIQEDTVILTNKVSDYTSTFSIFAMDEYNNKIIEFKYIHAFIKQLSNIDYTFQGGSEITCNATFAFSRLEVNLIKNVDKSNC
jgi:hypothetical protein